jgi:hydrogenase 3 maturation protease
MSNLPNPPNLLMGIGNSLREDDGAGPAVARLLQTADWTSLDCGTVPENFTGIVRRARPTHLVLVDAADMGLPPGSVRRIPLARLADIGLGTHALSLEQLARFLRDAVGTITLIGIQPERRGDGTGLTPRVRAAVEQTARQLADGQWQRLPELQ